MTGVQTCALPIYGNRNISSESIKSYVEKTEDFRNDEFPARILSNISEILRDYTDLFKLTIKAENGKRNAYNIDFYTPSYECFIFCLYEEFSSKKTIKIDSVFESKLKDIFFIKRKDFERLIEIAKEKKHISLELFANLNNLKFNIDTTGDLISIL